ncbi:HAD family hydrolase [Amycolatopsis cihanbeyliensis]|uniref:phosphoserine phosphatase n=1 Tax=Amycolatopsis cihanbeyliensis TaxID=1128664 RepID=A0A542DIU1_AMYCI|nr:HAD-IB family phosphatase [Amycolatopsis cihanbeyliensis]TQJ03018.1 phosphoserine phosphatase [Amycolatopsis cihanbeyliensis]
MINNDRALPDRARLFIFDMDGTLLPDTTGLLAVASALDTVDEVRELERQFADGTLSTVDFSRAVHRLWGVVPDDVARRAFDSCAKLEKIREVTERIANDGGISCLITMSQDFFADHFHEFGFDHVFASPYPRTAEAITAGVPESDILTPESKPLIADALCTKHGLRFADTVAFGDSGSDLPLFEQLRHTVAVNGNQRITELSSTSYRGNSLLGAYEAALEMIALCRQAS